jgi:hypothetical protein
MFLNAGIRTDQLKRAINISCTLQFFYVLGKHVFVKRKMLPKLFHRLMLYYMLYVRRKFKSAIIDLTKYIPILFVLRNENKPIGITGITRID